jgi:hypothetical protein
MEQILNSVLGSQQQKQDYGDFVNRYQNGHPSEGYSDQEVAQRYHQVAAHLPHDQFTKAAEQSFSRLSPQERKQFMQWMKQRNQQHGGHPHPQLQQHAESQDPSPSMLAGLLGGMQQQQPDMLSGLLTGSSGQSAAGAGILSNPIAKAVVSGIVAHAAKNMMG